MVTAIAKYAFWIIICIPAFAAVVWFSVRLIKENNNIDREIEEKKKAEEAASVRRELFEVSYSQKYSKDKKA